MNDSPRFAYVVVVAGFGFGGFDHLNVELLDEGELDGVVVLRHVPVLAPEICLEIAGLEAIAVPRKN